MEGATDVRTPKTKCCVVDALDTPTRRLKARQTVTAVLQWQTFVPQAAACLHKYLLPNMLRDSGDSQRDYLYVQGGETYEFALQKLWI